MGYLVSTPVFEGPFELLLHLVSREQVDLWEVELASIVDQYVEALERMEGLDLAAATEFLLIAAVLLELKARRLLPEPEGSDDEEELVLWEERDLLLARLLECKTFKEAALAISRLMEQAELSAPRRAGLEERFVGLAPDLLEGVSPERLRDVLAKLLVPKPPPVVNTEHVAPIRASVAETLEELVERLAGEGRTTFRRLTEGAGGRLEVIVYFLALLELYKRGMVDLSQAGKLAELHITWTGTGEETGASYVRLDAGAAASAGEGLLDGEDGSADGVPLGGSPGGYLNATGDGSEGTRRWEGAGGRTPTGTVLSVGVDEYEG